MHARPITTMAATSPSTPTTEVTTTEAGAGTIDLGMLRVIELYDRTLTPQKLQRALQETRERNGGNYARDHPASHQQHFLAEQQSEEFAALGT